jgi:hypothetical protein
MRFLANLASDYNETEEDALRAHAKDKNFLKLAGSHARFDTNYTHEQIRSFRLGVLNRFDIETLTRCWPDTYIGTSYKPGEYSDSYFRHWHLCFHGSFPDLNFLPVDTTWSLLATSQGKRKHYHLLCSFVFPRDKNATCFKQIDQPYVLNPIHTNIESAITYLEDQALETSETGNRPSRLFRDEYHWEFYNKHAALAGEYGIDRNSYLRYLQTTIYPRSKPVYCSTTKNAKAQSLTASLDYFAGFLYLYTEPSEQLIGFINEVPPEYNGQAVVCALGVSQQTGQAIQNRTGWWSYPAQIFYTVKR